MILLDSASPYDPARGFDVHPVALLDATCDTGDRQPQRPPAVALYNGGEEMCPERIAVRAIVSVYDKTGIVEFARGLNELGIEFYSTGGTEEILRGAGVSVRPVEQAT